MVSGELTVVVLCRNQADTVVDAIRSVTELAEQLGNVECVVVDDASTDGSPAAIRDALSSCGYQNQVLSLDQNLGTWSACARGFLVANSHLVTFLAGDDRLDVAALPRALDLIDSEIHPERKQAFQFGIRTIADGRQESLPAYRWSRLSWINAHRLVYQPRAPLGGLIISKSLSVPWHDFWSPQTFNLQEDWLFHLKLVQAGFRFYSFDLPIYLWTQDGPASEDDATRLAGRRAYFRGLNRGLMSRERLSISLRGLSSLGCLRDITDLSQERLLEAWQEGFRAGAGRDFDARRMIGGQWRSSKSTARSSSV